MQVGDSAQILGVVRDMVGANCLVQANDAPGVPGAEYWFHTTDVAVVPPAGGWPTGTPAPPVTVGAQVEILGAVAAVTSDSVMVKTPGTPAQTRPPVAAVPGWVYGLRSQHVSGAPATAAAEAPAEEVPAE